MSTILAERAGKKLFEKHVQQYTPTDPLYEFYTDAQGRKKQRKRHVPPGLSKRDELVLKSVNKRAHYLDKGLNLCGFRVGWTFFIGIVPGAGDAVNAGLNYFLVIRKAKQAELPNWLITRMLVNNAVAAVIGFVPVVGDICIAVFKTNSRNAALLEEYLRMRGEESLKVQKVNNRSESVVEPSSLEKPVDDKAQGGSPTNKDVRKGRTFFQRRSKGEGQQAEDT